jgi:hypothetical protein
MQYCKWILILLVFFYQVMDMEKNQADRELALEALAFDPHSTALFRHLHLGDNEPAAKEGLAAFQAAHLVHCPHKILWKEGGTFLPIHFLFMCIRIRVFHLHTACSSCLLMF